MLRLALSLLSSVQIGARIKETVERSLRQAAIIAVALLFVLAAAVFGLLALYHGLVSHYHFSSAEAAAIMAAVLLCVGLIGLAIVWPRGRAAKVAPPYPLLGAVDGVALAEQGMHRAVQEIGPVPLIAIAFLAGMLAGRR